MLFKLVQKLNRILGNRISDYYFYKWLRTKDESLLHRYIALILRDDS